MAIYKKKMSLGAFLKKGEDFKDGDIVEIANEGKIQEGQFGVQDIFLIKTQNGKEGNVSFNQTSVNNMIDAYGENSVNWVGKKAKVWGILSNVQGKMIKVYYYSHPEAELNEEGVFVLSGNRPSVSREVKDEDIPVVNVEEEDIDVKEIPF